MATKLVLPASGWPVASAAAAFDVLLTDTATKRLVTWLDLLATWNARVDLTAARSADELVDLMVADAIVLSSRIPPGIRVIDVGTGAGAPGLALAILRPDLEIALVEPLAKRGAFLRTVLGTLDLPRVKLDPRRGEVVASSMAREWDLAVARATLAPTPWLALARDLVKDGGSAWVFLAKEPNPTNPGFSFQEEVVYTWPLTAATRRLVRYERSDGARPGG